MLDKCKHHLDTVRESYLEHLCFAVQFGLRMMGAGLAAIVHAICPAVFEHTASRILFALHDEVRARQAKKTASTDSLHE